MTTDPRAAEQRSRGEGLATDPNDKQTSSAEPAKPPFLWILLPIILIAIAIYVAR